MLGNLHVRYCEGENPQGSTYLDPKKELLRLEKDGHRIEKVKRGYNIHTTPQTIRNTQLFRTLSHEIGHPVDYLYNSVKPSVNENTDYEYKRKLYNSKPSLDKEEYAHRYARKFYEKHRSEGLLPFERIYDKESLESLGLNENWFHY